VFAILSSFCEERFASFNFMFGFYIAPIIYNTMNTLVEIKLPTVRDSQLKTQRTSSIQIVKTKAPEPIRMDYENSPISSTPPSEFLAILKKRMDTYYSNPSTYNRNN
jgi:hypothetical protein